MEDNCNLILKHLKNCETLCSTNLPLDKDDVFPCIQKLWSKGMVAFDAVDTTTFHPTEEGLVVKQHGSPEFIIFNAIGDGKEIEQLKEQSVGLSHAFKNGWIKKEEGIVLKNKESVIDRVRDLLVNLCIDGSQNIDLKDVDYLKKRKLISACKTTTYLIRKGPSYQEELISCATELTSALITSGSYSSCEFKAYNFDTKGKIPEQGNLHPLMKVREEFRNIFLCLGFSEMQTDRYVESSFWNFDALFQPQQHPSRDAHDTFFIKEDLKIDSDMGYIERVKNMHQNGGYGSDGHRNIWDINEAKKGVLRTHTTAISARYLYKIANLLKANRVRHSAFNDKLSVHPQKCYKLFSIDKVFRNESVDATHLAEFHQIEGVIVGQNLTLGELMGIIEAFYIKLGMSDVKFKPAFNPYTEPSMEIFAFHKGLNKMIEIGNSGIFRPEMLKPMGFADGTVVFGFGLSLERPTMIKYGISNIRDLVGHKVDLDFIKRSEVCYF